MAKIPVGETIAKSYEFAFVHFPQNFLVSLLPALIPAITGAMIFHYFPMPTFTPTTAPAEFFREFSGLLALDFLLSMICMMAIFAALTREALGLREGAALWQFPFGAPTWRLIGAVIALFGVMAAIVLVVIAGGFAIGLATKAAISFVPQQDASVVTGLVALFSVIAIIVGYCAWIYVVIRLAFLVAPVTIAESRISIGRAWELSKGNFWRIFVVWLSVTIPLLLVELAVVAAMSGGHLFPPLQSGAAAQQTAEIMKQYNQSLQKSFDWSRSWYLTVPITVIITPFLYALLAAPAAFSYRALTSEQSDLRS